MSAIIYYDELCTAHINGAGGHPEQPARILTIIERVQGAECAARLDFRTDSDVRNDAPLAALELAHDKEHVRRIAATEGKSPRMLDGDTGVCADSWAAARRAAGISIAACESVLEGDRAFAVIRPPGHHAEYDHAMGFCLFNNAAVAAEYALRLKKRAERVAIVDWDVHHGNGTQHIFYRRSDVLYISVHQSPWYPGTGAADEIGAGEGKGYTLNFPLPAGKDGTYWNDLFETRVIPALADYKPDLVIVSAGFDAHRNDPLGGMLLESRDFGALAGQLTEFCSATDTRGPLCLLEGGYHLDSLAESVIAVADRLT